MAGKVIITCALTGSGHTPSMSPYLPYTVSDLVDQGVAAAEAGAAVLHLHARNPEDGSPSADPALFADADLLFTALPHGESARLAAELPAQLKIIDLAADFRFTRQLTQQPVKFSFTGPFSLSRRIRDGAYDKPGDLVRALARRLNAEARELAEAGAGFLQIDEPFLAGYPEQAALAVEAVNIVTDGVPVSWALHVCYGNRYARPSWEGHYDFLFPAVKAARVDQVVLEFARKGLDDLRLIRQHGWDKWLGLGVIDVKSSEVESAELVASRIRRALDYVPADRLMINPDCGLRHLAPEVARQKLRAMVAGVALVRAELGRPESPQAQAPQAPAPQAQGGDT